jgi:hypothetical protein
VGFVHPFELPKFSVEHAVLTNVEGGEEPFSMRKGDYCAGVDGAET